MASLHFPDYFHDELVDITRLSNSDKTIKFPVKNQFILASLAIHAMLQESSNIYSGTDYTIRNYNDELKKLTKGYLKMGLFKKNARDIPPDWKPKVI